MLRRLSSGEPRRWSQRRAAGDGGKERGVLRGGAVQGQVDHGDLRDDCCSSIAGWCNDPADNSLNERPTSAP